MEVINVAAYIHNTLRRSFSCVLVGQLSECGFSSGVVLFIVIAGIIVLQ